MVTSKSRISVLCDGLCCGATPFIVEGALIGDNCLTGEESCIARTNCTPKSAVNRVGGALGASKGARALASKAATAATGGNTDRAAIQGGGVGAEILTGQGVVAEFTRMSKCCTEEGDDLAMVFSFDNMRTSHKKMALALMIMMKYVHFEEACSI